MSNPYQQPTFTAYAAQAPNDQTNGMAVAGLICSLVGIITCGFLSPIGLLISLFGLSRPPRGLAIAGVAISVFGCLLAVATTLFAIKGFEAAEQIGQQFTAEMEAQKNTMSRLAEARQIIEKHKIDQGEYPSDDEGQALVDAISDGWEGKLRYKKEDDGYDLRSAGKDQKFDTMDDVMQGTPGVAEFEAEMKKIPKEDKAGDPVKKEPGKAAPEKAAPEKAAPDKPE